MQLAWWLHTVLKDFSTQSKVVLLPTQGSHWGLAPNSGLDLFNFTLCQNHSLMLISSQYFLWRRIGLPRQGKNFGCCLQMSAKLALVWLDQFWSDTIMYFPVTLLCELGIWGTKQPSTPINQSFSIPFFRCHNLLAPVTSWKYVPLLFLFYCCRKGGSTHT